MWKLLKYLKKYLKETIIAPFFKVLEVCFELLTPIVIASVIDNGIALGDKGHILKMCGILAVLAVVGLSCTLVAQYYAAKASVGFCTDIRSALFRHIGKLSYSKTDKIGTSTLITRLTGDLNQVQTGVNLTLRLLLRSPFVVFGAMLMAFIVDPKAALTFLWVIPLLTLVVFGVMLISIPLYKAVQQALDGVLSKTNENLRGVRVIRAFVKENEEISEFENKNSLLYSLQTRVGKISSILNPATVIIINIGIAVLIYNGALDVKAGGLTKGEVVALYNYMSQILVELIKLANLIINITKSIACGNRIQAVFETETENDTGKALENTSEYAVEFNNVTLKYSKNADPALKNIDFRIKKGETVGIIGATGSGKSSLINLIPRFYEATGGTVKVNGTDVREQSLTALRKTIGIVPQKAVLFKGTVRENMLVSAPDATDEMINTALKAAQGYDTVYDKKGGLDFEIEQEGKNLSGGQKQRLTIARALLRKPEILILDDSSSALDYATDAALRTALKNLDFETTVIIVSQRASALRHADKIIVLDNGEIAAIGTDEELKNTCDIYREIRRTQFTEKEGE